jgi:hypothetical protein
VVLVGQRHPPAVLDDDGLVLLDDEGGAHDPVARRELVARVDRGVVPLPVREEPGVSSGAGDGRVGLGQAAFGAGGAAADGLDRDRLDDELLRAVDEPEARLVGRLEGVTHANGVDLRGGLGRGPAA